MDLVKSWATAIVVYLVGSAFTVYIATAAQLSRADLGSTSGSITWNALPSLFIYLFMTLLGGLVHSSPGRDNAQRHALAVLLVPAVMVLITVPTGLAQGTAPVAVIAAAIAAAVGAFGGWAVVRWWRRRPQSEKASDGYF